MFCLYHFSVKCIIKKNYLRPYDPLKDSNKSISRVLSYNVISHYAYIFLLHAEFLFKKVSEVTR